MIIQRFFHLVFLFLFFVPLAEGQINKDQVKPTTEDHHHDGHHDEDHHHAHQDSSYHCGMCSSYLFDTDEVTNINNTDLHYHGIGSEEHKSTFQCAACNSHLGFYNHKHNNYEVLNKSVVKKDGGIFHCAACQMPLFEANAVDKQPVKKQTADNYNDLYTFFKAPINEDRIALEKRNKFYKTTDSDIHCRVCDGQLGGLNNNDSGGFGLRVNINKVKKQKKNKKK